MDAPVPEQTSVIIEGLTRRANRERQARLNAEAIAERSLRELYDKKEQLELIGSVATAANQSRSVEEVLQFALTKVAKRSTGLWDTPIYADPRQTAIA